MVRPMRRIVIWLASTVTIVVLLFGYHTSTNKTSFPGIPGSTSGPTTSTGKESSSSANSGSSGSTSGSAKITTYTGSVAQTRWGPVQVKITVQGGKLTKVTILQQPSGNSRDAEDQRLRAADLDQRVVEGAECQHRHGQRRDGDQ